MATSKLAVQMPAPGFTRQEAADEPRLQARRVQGPRRRGSGFPRRANDRAGSQSESSEDESGPMEGR